jgi:hypothetical protein
VVYSLEGVTNQIALGFMDLVARPAAWQTFPRHSKTSPRSTCSGSRTYLVEQQRTVGWFSPSTNGTEA